MRAFVNLLPLAYRRRELFRRRLLEWSLVWAACGGLTAGFWCLKHARYSLNQDALKAAQHRYLPLEKLTRQSTAMRAELERLQAKETALGQLLEERPLLTLIGLASEGARRCHGRLVVHTMLFRRHETRSPGNPDGTDGDAADNGQPSDPPPRNDGPWASVTFKGDAQDNMAVATFVVSLRDTGLFRRVELKSSLGSKSGDAGICSYELECDI